MPNSTNTNTVNYLLNAMKKQVPSNPSSGQTVSKDANVSKAEEAKKKREDEVKKKGDEDKKKKDESAKKKAEEDNKKKEAETK